MRLNHVHDKLPRRGMIVQENLNVQRVAADMDRTIIWLRWLSLIKFLILRSQV